MTKKRKTILTAGIAVAIAATLAVGATLAYLGSTQSVVNHITLVPGPLDASLTEPNFDPATALNLEPGTTVPKNPMITNTVGLSPIANADPNGEQTVTGTVINPDGTVQDGYLEPTDKTLTTPSSNVTEFAMIQLEFQGVNADGSVYDLQPWQINELMQVISFTSSTAADPTATNVGLDLTDWTLDTAQANYAASAAAVPDGTVATPNYVDYIYNTMLNSYSTDGNGTVTNGTPSTTNALFDSFTVNALANNQMLSDVAAWAPGGINIVCNGAVEQTDNLKVGDTGTDGSTLACNLTAAPGLSTVGCAAVVSDAAITGLEALLPIPATNNMAGLDPTMVVNNTTAITFASLATTTTVPTTTIDDSTVPPVTYNTVAETPSAVCTFSAVATYAPADYTPDVSPANVDATGVQILYTPADGDYSIY